MAWGTELWVCTICLLLCLTSGFICVNFERNFTKVLFFYSGSFWYRGLSYPTVNWIHRKSFKIYERKISNWTRLCKGTEVKKCPVFLMYWSLTEIHMLQIAKCYVIFWCCMNLNTIQFVAKECFMFIVHFLTLNLLQVCGVILHRIQHIVALFFDYENNLNKEFHCFKAMFNSVGFTSLLIFKFQVLIVSYFSTWATPFEFFTWWIIFQYTHWMFYWLEFCLIIWIS